MNEIILLLFALILLLVMIISFVKFFVNPLCDLIDENYYNQLKLLDINGEGE